MFSAVVKTFDQMFSPPFRNVLLKALGLTIVLFIGLLESIDPSHPSEADYLEIVKFVTTLLKG